jgi:hypothetical protein
MAAAALSVAVGAAVSRGGLARADVLAAAASASASLPLAIFPLAAWARLDRPAATWLQQDQLLNEHAQRFPRSTPAAIAQVVYNGRVMRQLVAAVDVPALSRMAVYPVELVADEEDEFDDTYAVRVYRQTSDGRRLAVEGVSGVPTSRSLSAAYVDGLPTIAMFANEPDASQTPNCRVRFPTVRAPRTPRVGDVHCGVLETTVSVRRGEPLMWCYAPPSVERAYPTVCAG